MDCRMEPFRVDLAYSDVTEALAMYKVKEPSVVSRQVICLRYFGYKVLPAIESEQQRLNKKVGSRGRALYGRRHTGT